MVTSEISLLLFDAGMFMLLSLIDSSLFLFLQMGLLMMEAMMWVSGRGVVVFTSAAFILFVGGKILVSYLRPSLLRLRLCVWTGPLEMVFDTLTTGDDIVGAEWIIFLLLFCG